MPSRAQGPVIYRRRLGVELKRLREAQGLRLEDVAAELDCSTSKISRLETGVGIPKARDIKDLAELYQVPEQQADRLIRWTRDGRRQGWWADHTLHVPSVIGTYLSYEADASVIRSFSTPIPHGLLQTTEYARALVSDREPWKTDKELDQLAGLRQRRQEALTRSDDPVRLVAVLDESALWRRVGSIAVMREQLEHLIKAAQLSTVKLHIYPFDAGAHEALSCPFTIMEYSDSYDRDVINVETHAGDRYIEDEANIGRYRRLFDDLTHRSLDTAESAALIEDIIRRRYS